jgi:hypothetical protein
MTTTPQREARRLTMRIQMAAVPREQWPEKKLSPQHERGASQVYHDGWLLQADGPCQV